MALFCPDHALPCLVEPASSPPACLNPAAGVTSIDVTSKHHPALASSLQCPSTLLRLCLGTVAGHRAKPSPTTCHARRANLVVPSPSCPVSAVGGPLRRWTPPCRHRRLALLCAHNPHTRTATRACRRSGSDCHTRSGCAADTRDPPISGRASATALRTQSLLTPTNIAARIGQRPQASSRIGRYFMNHE